MFNAKTAGQDLAKGAGLLAGHVVAVVLGLALMIAGLALGVSLVLLPVGIVVGLAGCLLFVFGLSAWGDTARPPGPPA